MQQVGPCAATQHPYAWAGAFCMSMDYGSSHLSRLWIQLIACNFATLRHSLLHGRHRPTPLPSLPPSQITLPPASPPLSK
jgi:hypothetical protein